MLKTILIIDDSASVRQVAGITLKRAGYNVIEAIDGLDALTKLDDGPKIHLIISDINMPNMDGIAFVKAAKNRLDSKFIPIIMLTTHSEEHKKQEGRDAGAKAWIVKPFQPAQMLAAVSKLVLP